MNKPVKPVVNGILDYIFSGIQVLLPAALRFNKKAVKYYRQKGMALLAVNALTNTPAGVKKLFRLKTTRKLMHWH